MTLRTKLSFAIAGAVLLTVLIIIILSNFLIQDQFKNYLLKEQERRTQTLVAELSQQYVEKAWNIDSIHTIGMSALYDGYIIKVYNSSGDTLWDAEAHNMSLCAEIMDEIAKRTDSSYPRIKGEVTSKTVDLVDNSDTIGAVQIVYYGPFFLNENEYQFLSKFNSLITGIAVFFTLVAVLVGIVIAQHISMPIMKTVDAAKQIADGNYEVRISDKTDTKEINRLIQSINHLAGSLEKQDLLRKQLTGDVAHELRTPIAIIQAQTEAMLDGVWEPTPERLQSCHDEIVRMGKLASDLEKLAEADAGNLRLEKVKFNFLELIKTILSSFEAKVTSRRLNVEVRGETIWYFGDRDRISQVIVNLLANAVKYCGDGGKILITLWETETAVVFAVEDDGIGIPEAEQPYIFQRFYRTEKSRTRKSGGSGIGLAIVKSIVQAHGGTVRVKSQLNEGSCFEVVLPKQH